MAQFFGGNLAGPSEMGEMLSSGLKAGAEARELEKRKTLDALFAKHTDAAGNLSPAFLKDATAAGLGRAEIEQYAQYQGGQKAQGVTDAQNNMMLRALGYEPQAQGRNQAQYGAPELVKLASPSLSSPEAGAGAPLGPSSIDPDKLRSPSEVGGVPATASSGRGASPAAADGTPDAKSMDKWWEWLNSGDKAKEQSAKEAFDKAHASGWKSWGEPAQNEVLIQGQVPASKSEEARMAPDTVGSDVFAPVQDPRSWNQRLEDSYNPAKDPSAQVGQAGAGMQPSEDLFKWEPTNEGNQFRQFSTALAAKLNSAGIKDPSEYLHRVYQANFAANMPAQPNAMLRTQGPEGIAKYQQQVMDFNAGIQKAQGAAQKALMDARDKLDSIAKDYGTSSVEDRKSYVGDGYTLRDTSKRDVANALLVNRDNINHSIKAVGSAGLDKTKLTMALPQLVRAYATSLNPGQQLSEGNLAEVTAMALPELADKKELMAKLAVGIFNAMRGKTDVLQDIANGADAQTASALRGAMVRIAGELPGLNERALGNYVIPPKGSKGFSYSKIGGEGGGGTKAWATKPDATAKVGDTYKGYTLGNDGKWH